MLQTEVIDPEEHLPRPISATDQSFIRSSARRQEAWDRERINISRKVYDQYCFDEEYGYHADMRNTRELATDHLKKHCGCTKEGAKTGLKKYFLNLLPIIYWLPRYEVKRDLVSDIVSGLTVGIMHIPQGMAYASLAKLPPVIGLYTSFYPSLMYTFFGTSAHISIGTFAVVSLMTGGVRNKYVPDSKNLFAPDYVKHLADMQSNSTNFTNLLDGNTTDIWNTAERINPMVVVSVLTLLVGLVQLVMGFCRLGFLIHYLSDQLVNGYTTGVALIIFTTQVGPLFGIASPDYEGPGKLYFSYRDIIKNLDGTIPATIITSVICMIVIFLVKTFVNERYKEKMRVPIPIDLFVVIIATIASYFGDFKNKYHVKIVDNIPTGLPPPKVPDIGGWVGEMLPEAIPIAIVGYAVSVSMAQLFARKHRYIIDANQELYAYGIVNLVSSFFSCWPSGASVPRSCVMESAGSRTQLSTFISSTVVLIVLVSISRLFEPLPSCVLAAIIVVALKGMFLQLKELKPLWYISKFDFAIFLFSFLATISLDVVYGLAASIGFAMLTVVIRSQRPPALILGRIPHTDIFMSVKRYDRIEEIAGVKIFRFDTALYFANSALFRDKMYEYIQIDFVEMRKQAHEEERDRRKAQKAAERMAMTPHITGGHPTLRQRVSRTVQTILPGPLRRRVFPNSNPPQIISDCRTVDEDMKHLGFKLEHPALERIKALERGSDEPTSNGLAPHPHTQSTVLDLRRESLQLTPAQHQRNMQRMMSAPELSSPPPLNRLQSIALERNPFLPHHIIIDCSGFNYIDVMGMRMLIQIYRELKEINVALLLANCKTPVRQLFETTNFYTEVPKDCVYLTVQDAVMAAEASYYKSAHRQLNGSASPLAALNRQLDS